MIDRDFEGGDKWARGAATAGGKRGEGGGGGGAPCVVSAETVHPKEQRFVVVPPQHEHRSPSIDSATACFSTLADDAACERASTQQKLRSPK